MGAFYTKINIYSDSRIYYFPVNLRLPFLLLVFLSGVLYYCTWYNSTRNVGRCSYFTGNLYVPPLIWELRTTAPPFWEQITWDERPI